MTVDSTFRIVWVDADAASFDIAHVRRLFLEYQREMGVDLCFQGFQQELDGLPGDYAPPGGRLWLAWCNDLAVGCAALRRLDAQACEMKRLYLQPAYRGGGRGRQLAETCIATARALGYRQMRLDTLPLMQTAIALYGTLGFVTIPAYRANPVEGALFLELDLSI